MLCFLLFLVPTLPLAFSEQIVIPAVQSAVSAQLSKFAPYTSYHGTATVATPLPTPRVKINAIAAPAVVAPAANAISSPFPYWYENIAHQGKAAFNSNASYVVYRNVKDYGAKG